MFGGETALEDGDLGANLERFAMTSILMVCMGNICRSPMAQTVAQKLAAETNIWGDLKFDSAGTHAFTSGQRPDRRAMLALSNRGYEMVHTFSRRVAQQDFEAYDLILAMDLNNLNALERVCPSVYQGKLRLLLSFAEGLKVTEIPDPYYGNAEGFERVLDLCEAGARGLIKHYIL